MIDSVIFSRQDLAQTGILPFEVNQFAPERNGPILSESPIFGLVFVIGG
jgi:hypothetical protein